MITASVMFVPYAGLADEYADNPGFVIDRAAETELTPIVEVTSVREVDEKGNIKSVPSPPGQARHYLKGTGFIVSPCYILTAAHAVFGKRQRPTPRIDYRMTVSIGDSDSKPFAASFIASVDLSLTGVTATSDWALLKFPTDKCLGVHPRIGWYEGASSAMTIGTKALGLGYWGNRSLGTLVGGWGLTEVQEVNGEWAFSGSFVRGASGGPLLMMENGSIKAVGLITSEIDWDDHEAYPSYSYDHANRVQDTFPILHDPRVAAILNADKARFGNVNPAAERLRRPLPTPQTVPH